MRNRSARTIFHVDDWLDRRYHTTDFVGRAIGKAWREDVESWLRDMAPGSLLTIDFTGVDALDFTAADEGVVKLLGHVTTHECSDVWLAFMGTTASHEHNLTVALERRRVAIVVLRKEGPAILGHLHPYLRAVFMAVVLNHPLTSRGLADATQQRISLAATALLSLYQRRLVRRGMEGLPQGGHQYVYWPVEGQLTDP